MSKLSEEIKNTKDAYSKAIGAYLEKRMATDIDLANAWEEKNRTLEGVPNENGGAKIKQLYLPHNIECDEKTRLFIVTNLLPLFSSGELKFENKLTVEEVSC